MAVAAAAVATVGVFALCFRPRLTAKGKTWASATHGPGVCWSPPSASSVRRLHGVDTVGQCSPATLALFSLRRPYNRP